MVRILANPNLTNTTRHTIRLSWPERALTLFRRRERVITVTTADTTIYTGKDYYGPLLVVHPVVLPLARQIATVNQLPAKAGELYP
jgi:hypothetical protein